MLDYMRQKIAISITYFRLAVATAFAIMMLSFWPASVLALSEMQAGVIVAIRGEAEIKRKDHLITASSGTAVIAGDTIITGNNSWTQIALRDHAIDGLVVDIPVGTLQLSSTDPNAAITNATAEMTTSIGSIADGNSVIDGRLGLFAVTLTPDTASSPALSGQAIIAGQ